MLDTGATIEATTRVIQGLATGIGFVGAGAILKSAQSQQVHGLTTASSIWLTAGLGTAAGAGRIWLPLIGSLIALVILSLLPALRVAEQFAKRRVGVAASVVRPPASNFRHASVANS